MWTPWAHTVGENRVLQKRNKSAEYVAKSLKFVADCTVICHTRRALSCHERFRETLSGFGRMSANYKREDLDLWNES